MTEHLLNKPVEEALQIAEIVERMIENGAEPDRADLAPLLLLASVAEFPARIPCAQLGWQTLRRALSSSESS
jgi:nitrogen fixation NifU-like protein